MEDEEEKKSKKDSLSTKTPAPGTEKVKKSAKSSRTAKSTKKRAAPKEDVNEQTPRVKKSKPDQEVENDPLAMLKRRLTMISTKNNQQLPSRTQDENGSESNEGQNPADNEDVEDSKRGRRNKKAISYVPLNLNAKLRQGDSLFVESSNNAKVKAEQSRLAIAQKMCISTKTPKDNKENMIDMIDA